MTYLFIDDVRPCPPNKDGVTWKHVKSYSEAIAWLTEKGCSELISFDHDLGSDLKTGYDIAKWIVERDLDSPGFIPNNFKFAVHSANPVGKRNIEDYLTLYFRVRTY